VKEHRHRMALVHQVGGRAPVGAAGEEVDNMLLDMFGSVREVVCPCFDPHTPYLHNRAPIVAVQVV
jgi:hypothetical protein